MKTPPFFRIFSVFFFVVFQNCAVVLPAQNKTGNCHDTSTSALMSSSEAKQSVGDATPETSQDLTIFVQNLLEQMVT